MTSILQKDQDPNDQEILQNQEDNQNTTSDQLKIDGNTSKLVPLETPINTTAKFNETQSLVQIFASTVVATNLATQEEADSKYSPVIALDVEVPSVAIRVIDDPNQNFDVTPVTPYKFFTDAVPKMFDFVAVHNKMLDPFSQSSELTYQNTQIGELPAARASSAIFNHTTMVVREKMVTEFNGVSLGSPLTGGEGLISINTTNSATDPTQKVDQEVSLILYIIRFAMLLQDLVLKIPSIINNTTATTQNPVVSYFSNVNHWIKDDNPSLVLAACNMNPGWLVDEIAAMLGRAQTTLGRSQLAQYGTTMTEAKVSVITDQFTSKIFNLNYNKLKTHQLDPVLYAARITANMYEEGCAMANYNKPATFVNLNYSPNESEWNQAMYLFMVSKKYQAQFYATALNAIQSSGRLITQKASDMFTIEYATVDGDVARLKNTLTNLLAQGTNSTVYELLMFETFHFFQFTKMAGYQPVGGADGFLRLLGLFSFYLFFPKLATRITNQLQQTIYDQLDTLFILTREDISKFGRVVDKYGAKSTLRDVSYSASQQGYKYSLFHPGYRVRASPCYKYVQNVMQLMPSLQLIDLDRKKAAGYPFFMSEYRAHASWKKLSALDAQNGEVKDILIQIVNETRDLYKEWRNLTSQNKKTQGAMDALFRSLELSIESIGTLFHYTMPRMQEMLMNSFGYMYDDWTGDRLVTPLVLGVSRAADNPGHVQYINGTIDPTCTLRVLATVEGDYPRGLLKHEKFVTNQSVQRRDLRHVSGHEIDDLGMSCVVAGRKMANVIKLLQLLLRPNDDTNPIQEIAQAIAPISKRSTFNAIVTKFTEMFLVDYDDIAIKNVFESRMDVRKLRMAIIPLDGSGNSIVTNPGINAKFNTDFSSVDTVFYETMRILSNVLFNQRRPVAFHRGSELRIGKYTVEELHPNNNINQLVPRLRNQYDCEDITFKTEMYHYGQHRVLQVGDIVYSLPYTQAEPFEIIANRPSDIPLNFREPIAQAVADGAIFLTYKDFNTVYDVVDIPDRVNRPLTSLTKDQIYNLMMMTDQSILHTILYNSEYATNHHPSVYTVRRYPQFLSVDGDSSGNVHCTLLTNTETKYQGSVVKIPDYTRYAYGTVSHTNQFERCIGDVPKTQLDYINWNNDIYCIDSDVSSNVIGLSYELTEFTEE
uniref:Major core protein n=1 Tax=Shenzhen reo-like virus 4 TaxID=2789382 RepID=A0A7S8WJR9_9REOV|nr:major core protein [Shenzhen reo-like virus 4]